MAKCPFNKFKPCDPQCAMRAKGINIGTEYTVAGEVCALAMQGCKIPNADCAPKFVSETVVYETEE